LKNNRFNQEWKLRADVFLAKLVQLTHILLGFKNVYDYYSIL
jgi:hypothetical protein